MGYIGLSGKTYTLGRQIGGGGEGAIHEIAGNATLVAKIFKPSSNLKEKEEKVKAMIPMAKNSPALKYTSWPQDALYDNGRFVGFTMLRIPSNLKINEINETSAAIKYSWASKIRIAYNLCSVVDSIHRMGQCCGDFNPNNICVDTKTGSVYLIDTDSFHITSVGKTYRCSVGMGEYLPKQIQDRVRNGQTLETVPLPTFTKETDNFALAIHVFQLLMNGCHPFTLRKISMQDSACVPTQIDNINNGRTAFFKPNTGFDIPVFAPKADILPPYIHSLFEKAFVSSYANGLNVCPRPSDWMGALKTLMFDLKTCAHNSSHQSFNKYPGCPWCEVERKMTTVVAPPVRPPVAPTRTPISPYTTPARTINYADEDSIVQKDGAIYHVTGNNATLVMCNRTDRKIVLPSTIIDNGNTSQLTRIDDGAFQGNQTLEEITIPGTVKSIGASAFARCSKLKIVNIPSSVRKIGEMAFTFCYSLEEIQIPSGVRSISDGMFNMCPELKRVTLGTAITTIGKHAFANCFNLTHVNFARTLKVIGAYAFENCVSIENMVITDNVTNIGEYAFLNCVGLKSVTLPKNIKEIKKGTFKNTRITSVTIPSKVYVIYEEAFYLCIELQNVSSLRNVMKICDKAFSCTNISNVEISRYTGLMNHVFPPGMTYTKV